MILTHGDSNIKEQLRKYSQKRKVVLHLENYEDNFICGSCVRENEAALRWNGNSRSVHSSGISQEADNSGKLLIL